MTMKQVVKYHNFMTQAIPTNTVIRLKDPMNWYCAAKTASKLPDEIYPELQLYSGTILILITEAPHHNLYQWASRIREKNGIVYRMTSNGYHDANVWMGVIFQIVAALHVMQIHGIYMRNMTIEDNIYIKDLQVSGKSLGYWKYVIDGISYYIPNYGYVVLVDSNFKDIYSSGSILDKCKREYKIYTSNIFKNKYSINSIRQKVFENYRNIINTNAFTKEHTQNNVFRPPDSVMKLIETMMTDSETDLGKIIEKYFRLFMNNRIGTLLRKETEIPHIRDVTENFKYGEMAMEIIEHDLYKWCLVLKTNPDGLIDIITRSNPQSCDFENKTVRIETLKKYSPVEKIEQNTNLEINFSEDGLLETYIVNSSSNNFNNNC